MAKAPIIKINTNFKQFSAFTKLFDGFKKDIALPKNVGISIDKNAVNVLQTMARDLRVIAQIQMAVIGNSKKFKEAFKNINLESPVIHTNPKEQKVIPPKKSLTQRISIGTKKLAIQGLQKSFGFAAAAFPAQTYALWHYGQKTGRFIKKTGNILTKVNNNPLVVAMKKLTIAITKLSIKGVTGGLTKALKSFLGAVSSIPIVGGMAVGIATGGIMGIGAATNRATGLRSQSREMGLTSGQLLAGRNVLSPYFDFEGMARYINSEKTKLGSKFFMVHGNNRNDSTFDLVIKNFRRAAEIGREYKGNMDSLDQNQELKMRGIAPVTVQALSGLSIKEIDEISKRSQQDSKKLNQSDDRLKKLQDLNTNLGITSDLIKNKFAMAIAAVSPKIEEFGKFLQNLMDKLFNAKTITGLLNGIEKIGKLSPSFLNFIQKMINGMPASQKMGGVVESVMKGLIKGDSIKKLLNDNFFKPLLDDFKSELITPLSNMFSNLMKTLKNMLPKWAGGGGDDPKYQKAAYYQLPLLENGVPGQWRRWKGNNDNIALGQKATYQIPKWMGKEKVSEQDKNKYLDSINKAIGLPTGYMQAIRQIESSGNDKATNPHSSALGAFQMTRAARKDYGLPDYKALKFGPNAEAAAKDILHLMRVYQNDYRKAAVAYHWGPGNLDTVLKNHRANWESHLDKGSTKYLHDLDRLLSQNQANTIQLNVHNNTGGSSRINARMASGLSRLPKGLVNI